MARYLTLGGTARPMGRSISSMACLAFVVLLGLAFWAGAAWLGQVLLQMGGSNL